MPQRERMQARGAGGRHELDRGSGDGIQARRARWAERARQLRPAAAGPMIARGV